MKKKAIAAAMAAIMLAVSMSVPSFARYDEEGSTYDHYGSTDTLEAEVDTSNDKIVLTWPAVDTEGNLIKANPMTADGQQQSNGNPTRGWTNPTSGMIIAYDGWLPDGTHNSISNDNKTNHDVIMGVVDKETEYPIYIFDPKVSEKTDANIIKKAYVDTTVVTHSLATAYKIEYSSDNGSTWALDHVTTSFNHGKKLCRAVTGEDGTVTYKEDNKNTFFLEDQLTEALTANLQPETEYMLRVTATDASNTSASYKVFDSIKITTPAKKELTPAFASAEGSGIYSQGGRGGDVYVVTNLTDSVNDPQPGSLRYGLERKDLTGDKKLAPRTIVFAVGGTIKIDESATKSARRMNVGSNTTILGQTAPGEGITVAGSSMKFDGSNIVVRYMRFRLGGGYDNDAASATGENIVIDHCTFSWGVDEVFSAKEIINSSIQYNIMSSGLAMPDKNGAQSSDVEVAAGESEAKHGMGSILNGYDVSYTHNLWAHNGTRNPRFEGGFEYNGVRYENKINYANNVVYDWGHNSTYGGERGKGEMNFVNNYYKPGPETLEKVKYFFDCDSGGANKGSYYFTGNVFDGNEAMTASNEQGFVGDYTKLDKPVELTLPYEASSAEEAYYDVLNNAGASFHRDAHDARLIYEAENGVGAFVNSEAEAGGWSEETYDQTITDTDGDGLPDETETLWGLDPADKTDSTGIIDGSSKIYGNYDAKLAGAFNGYSYIEAYAGLLVNDWPVSEDTRDPMKVYNNAPNVQITGITDKDGKDIINKTGNTTLIAGETYTVVPSKAVSGTKVYVNDKSVGDDKLSFTAGDTGVYNLALLSEENGFKSFSAAVPVTVVKGTGNIEGFTSVDIGSPGSVGADNYDVQTGTLYSQGAGRIGITNTSGSQNPDSFHYNYTEVKGDFEFTARIDNLSKVDYMQKSGLMARASLDPSSEFYMAGFTYLKGEDYMDRGQSDITGGVVKAKNIKAFSRKPNKTGVEEGGFISIAAVKQGMEPNHGYGRITREGSKVTISASADGENWYVLSEEENTALPETCYVGFATSAAQDTSTLVRYNATAFSNISLTGFTFNNDVLLGDVNCDGIITAADCTLALEYGLGDRSVITEQGIRNMAVTNDGDAENIASEILRKVLDNTHRFPVEIQ